MYEEDEIYYRNMYDKDAEEMMPPEVNIKRVFAFMITGLIFSFALVLPGCN